jgi:predicted aspartyl protease
MKLIAACLLALFLSTSGANAQESADQRIVGHLNQNNWFALEEDYPKMKDQIQTPILNGLSEVMISLRFNQPERALAGIDSLIINCPNDLGFSNICSMILFKGKVLGEQGLYAQSADFLNRFLDQVPAATRKENFASHIALAKYYTEVRNEPKPEITRPNTDTEVPLSIKKVGRGVLMFVPVTIHGKTYPFIFDTGASSSVVSERLATEMGFRTVRDTMNLAGVGTGVGKCGTVDSIMVGEIAFRHPIFTIIRSSSEVDTVFQVDAVLGLDFIRMVGETQIYPHEGKIRFPAQQTALPPTGRNLMLEDGQSYLKAYSGDERLVFHFDTGNVRADLFNPYYLRHKEMVDRNGVKDSYRGGGFGGMQTVNVIRLAHVPLTVSGVTFDLANIPVSTEAVTKVQKKEDGSMGMDFINLFKKITINYDKMFMTVEK